MRRTHLQYALTVVALGVALHALLWKGTVISAQRSAPAPPPAPAPTEAERALALFKAKAEQVQRFLAQEPMYLSKQDFKDSPTREIYYHIRVRLLESGFDVQRSDSLVSPFLGYLDLTLAREETIECGDVAINYSKIGRYVFGHSTYEKAMARVHDCFRRARAPIEHVRLTFAYQNGRWVFKDAILTKDNKKEGLLLAALGRAEPPHHRVADNQAWEALIQ
jgi:hypothetical protein